MGSRFDPHAEANRKSRLYQESKSSRPARTVVTVYCVITDSVLCNRRDIKRKTNKFSVLSEFKLTKCLQLHFLGLFPFVVSELLIITTSLS
jgi:hypothetical protein